MRKTTKLLLLILLALGIVFSCKHASKKPIAPLKEKKVVTEEKKAPAKTEMKKNTNKNTVICSHKSDKRIIEIVPYEEYGCQTTYNKFGEEQIVATAQHEKEICENVAQKIQSNLENAGFNCN